MEVIVVDSQNAEIPGTPKTPHTPKSPKSPLWTLTRTLSVDPSTRTSGSWYSGTALLLAGTSHEEDPPPSYEPTLFTLGFSMKLAQWGICILCTGLHSEGSTLIKNFRHRIFPYVTAWTYMIVTGIILLSYLLGQKMREMLIRIYNLLGGIMFLVTGIIIVYVVATHWAHWVKDENSGRRERLMLAHEAALSFVNSALYFADTAYSLHRSYATITLEEYD